MSKNKSFFQKLSDSFTSLFPFNSTTRDNVSQVSFERNLSPIMPSNRRIASEVFGRDEDETKTKRAKLHYDLKSFPTSRIIKPMNNQLPDRCNAYNNNFNDTASDFSDTSNVSVSTSGVSSLHPRSTKRLNLGHSEDFTAQNNSKYPRNLNLSQKIISPVSHKSLKNTKEFMSSPAKKILEKLDKLTTPITAADKLTSLLVKDRLSSQTKVYQPKPYNPYSRPIPPICGKKPIPVKAVTVLASSDKNNCGPIRHKQAQKMKRLAYTDDIDLDSEITNNSFQFPKFDETVQVNFSSIPLLKKSISTNTDESYLFSSQRSLSPDLEFTFRAPQTVNDKDYLLNSHSEIFNQLKSKENSECQKQCSNENLKSDTLWRCDNCLNDNFSEFLPCTNCKNILKKNQSPVVLFEETFPTNIDKSTIVKKSIENENDIVNVSKSSFISIAGKEIDFSNAPVVSSSQVNMDFSKLNSVASSFNSTIILENNTSKELKSIFVENLATSTSSSALNTSITTSSISSVSLSESNLSIFNTKTSKPFIEVLTTINSVVSSNSGMNSFGFMSTVTPSLTISTLNSNSKSLLFGQPSTAEYTSSLTVPSTSNSTSFLFGQPSSAESVSSSIIFNSKPFSFDQISSAEPASSSTVLSTSNSKSFMFGQSSSEDSSSLSTSKTKTFLFGQISGAESTSLSTLPPISNSKPFLFGEASIEESTSSTTLNSKPFLFGQASSAESASFMVVPSMSNSKPFLFGQTASVEHKSIVSESTSVVNPASFIFGDNQKPVTSSTTLTNSINFPLFSSIANIGLKCTGVFGASQPVMSTVSSISVAPLMTIEPSKSVNAFTFTNPSNTFGITNSSSSGFMFNNTISTSTPSMNFSQSLSNNSTSQNQQPFSLTTQNNLTLLTNNTQFNNATIPSQTANFTFGAIGSSASNAAFTLPTSNMFNFNSNQPEVFLFGSNSNVPNQSNLGMVNSSVNSRRTLKVRRNRK